MKRFAILLDEGETYPLKFLKIPAKHLEDASLAEGTFEEQDRDGEASNATLFKESADAAEALDNVRHGTAKKCRITELTFR